MVHRNARQLDVVVLRTPLEHVRGDPRLLGGIGFDALMPGRMQAENASVHI